jgi:hypothetical protein
MTSLIHATHRPCDLIPVFLDALQDYDRQKYLEHFNAARLVDVFAIDDAHPW